MNRYLVFHVAGERLALKIRTVEDVLGLGDLVRDGNGLAFAKLGHHGEPVPVLDLRPLGREVTEDDGDRYCVVVVEAECEDERLLLGLLVDGMAKTVELDQPDAQADCARDGRPRTGLRGVAPVARLLNPHDYLPAVAGARAGGRAAVGASA